MGFQANHDPRYADPTNGHLTITTSTTVLVFSQGAIIYVKDALTDEVILNSNDSDTAAILTWSAWSGSVGITALVDGVGYCTRMADNRANPTWTLDSDDSGHLTYANLYDESGAISNSSIVFYFTIDLSGAVQITCDITWPVGSWDQVGIKFPIVNYTGSGVILSNGVLYQRNDGAINTNPYSGMPMAATLLGNDSVIGFWSEVWDGRAANDCEVMYIRHTTTNDVLCSAMPQIDRYFGDKSHNTMSGGPWRVGVWSNWLEVAKAWRVQYEDKTGAKKLWESLNPLARQIHTKYDGIRYTLADYQAISSSFYDTSKVMLQYWNAPAAWGYCFIADPVFCINASPSQDQIDWARSCGFKVMNYMPWTMFTTQTPGEQDRMDDLTEAGRAPEGYQFTPRWPGVGGDQSKTAWYAQWSTRDTGAYLDDADTHMIYPGFQEFTDYINYNYNYYKEQHNCDLLFIDISGQSVKLLMQWDAVYGTYPHYIDNPNNLSYAEGETAAIEALAVSHPEIPLISEYLSTHLKVPFAYGTYVWDGSGLNHPFRTALYGSYTWILEDIHLIQGKTPSQYPFKAFALVAGLPCILMDDDTDGVLGPITQAKSKLFCKFDLFNDNPVTWENATFGSTPFSCAYYRSNTNNMFRLEDRGSNVFAYVEEHWQGDYDRLVIDTGVVTTNNIDEELPSSYYTRGSYISLPSDDTDLAIPYNVDDIADVAADDTDMVGQLATSQIAIHQFKQQMNGTGGIINAVAQVTIPCSTSTTYLQIYNRQSEPPAWDTIDSDNATGANTDFTLSATVADLTDYKDENNIVACRVYQEMQ